MTFADFSNKDAIDAVARLKYSITLFVEYTFWIAVSLCANAPYGIGACASQSISGWVLGIGEIREEFGWWSNPNITFSPTKRIKAVATRHVSCVPDAAPQTTQLDLGNRFAAGSLSSTQLREFTAFIPDLN